MLAKDKVIETIKTLPDSFSIDDLVDKMILLQKIENGLAQSDRDEVIDDDQLDEKLGKWLS
jgi:hypothetical protein